VAVALRVAALLKVADAVPVGRVVAQAVED
jgi:hypothetical protein